MSLTLKMLLENLVQLVMVNSRVSPFRQRKPCYLTLTAHIRTQTYTLSGRKSENSIPVVYDVMPSHNVNINLILIVAASKFLLSLSFGLLKCLT